MAINQCKKQKAKSAETNKVTPANNSSEKQDSTRPDTSDLSWLTQDTLLTLNHLNLHARGIPVLETLNEQDLTLGDFVWAVNWSNEASRNHKMMQKARKEFRGEYPIPTLQNITIPPRTNAKGDRPEGVKQDIDDSALSLVGTRLGEEMRGFEHHYEQLKPETLTEDNLMDFISFNRVQSLIYT